MGFNKVSQRSRRRVVGKLVIDVGFAVESTAHAAFRVEYPPV